MIFSALRVKNLIDRVPLQFSQCSRVLISSALLLSKVFYLSYKLHNHYRVLIGPNNKVPSQQQVHVVISEKLSNVLAM